MTSLEIKKQEQLDKIDAAKKTIRNLECQIKFEKLQLNERLDLETNGESFYHGQLKYKNGELVDYYNLGNDFFYVRYPIEGGYGYDWVKGWDWREFIIKAHDCCYDESLPAMNNDKIESNTIIYESPNARKFTPNEPRITMKK